MESSKQIDEQAARWLVKRDGGHWTEGDQAELEGWLQSSTAHLVAYLRLDTAWKRMHRLKSLGAGIPQGVVPSPDDWQLSPFFDERPTKGPEPRVETAQMAPAEPVARRRPAHWSIAAGIAALAVAVAWYSWPAGPAYRTPVGGLASVPMADGSKITLNTDSAIRVSVTETERRVRLEHGEAFFEVAKDPRRPFVVTAADKRVIAVGTAFSVHREGNDIRVVVTEGKVKVEQTGLALPREVGAGQSDLLLPAGSVALTQRDQVVLRQKPLPQLEEDLSWRTGYLTFRETTLADAVAEFNRYNVRRIHVQDPALAALRLSGKFQSTQYEAFIRLLEEGFSIQARSTEDRIVLTAR